MKQYLWGIFIALTQLLNALLGGWPDETTSSRAWRLEQQGSAAGRVARIAIDTLFFWQRGHCESSYDSERARYQLPPILR